MTNTQSPSLLIVGSDEIGRNLKVAEIIEVSPETQINNPDFLLLSSLTSIGIEDIRNLQRFLSLKPFHSRQKVALIKEAQNLTTEAQNAFLKTLEEPPANSLIILTAPNTTFLLPTIVSRCQIVQLPPKSQVQLSPEELTTLLEVLKKLFSSSLAERWKMAEELAIFKDRQTALNFLDRLTFVSRILLLENYQEKKAPKNLSFSLPSSFCLRLLNSIRKTKIFLQANCNVRLTLEAFLLNLPVESPSSLKDLQNIS